MNEWIVPFWSVLKHTVSVCKGYYRSNWPINWENSQINEKLKELLVEVSDLWMSLPVKLQKEKAKCSLKNLTPTFYFTRSWSCFTTIHEVFSFFDFWFFLQLWAAPALPLCIVISKADWEITHSLCYFMLICMTALTTAVSSVTVTLYSACSVL